MLLLNLIAWARSTQQFVKIFFAKGGLVENSPNFSTTKVSLHIEHANLLHLSKCICITQEHENLLLVHMLLSGHSTGILVQVMALVILL